LPKFEISTWYGILAPAGTPAPVVARLNEAIVSVLKAPATSKRFVDLGADPVWNTPEQFAALIQADTQKWGKVIKATGARAD
jgi:tripartite-type tricarboxylate transporter receptor subunit TctC